MYSMNKDYKVLNPYNYLSNLVGYFQACNSKINDSIFRIIEKFLLTEVEELSPKKINAVILTSPTNGQVSPLIQLPTELWLKIFAMLDDSNLRQATCVCKQWKEFGYSTSVWISWIKHYSPTHYENLAAIKSLIDINWVAIGKGFQRQRSSTLKIEKEITKIEKDHQEIKKNINRNLMLIIYPILLKGFIRFGKKFKEDADNMHNAILEYMQKHPGVSYSDAEAIVNPTSVVASIY